MCNKATRALDREGRETIIGDPTEIGLLRCTQLYGYDKENLEKIHPLEKEYPFDSDRKRMSVVRVKPANVRISYVK